MRISPVLKVLYLLCVAIAAFLVEDLRLIAAIAGLQLLAAFATRVPGDEMLRIGRRIAPFVLLLGLANALTFQALEPAIAPTARMGLRVLAVILASAAIRQGSPGELIAGLRRLGMPVPLASALDLTLALFSGPRKRGEGKGQGKRHRGSPRELLSRTLDDLIGSARQRLTEVEGAIAERVDIPEAQRKDLSVVVALSLVGLSLKAVKILPGIPFAPGHKGIVLLPLYVLASALTGGRWGATTLGTVLGVVSFLFGDGQFGVLEIAKHIAPGIAIDLLAPVAGRRPAGYAILGIVAALARLSTMLAVGWLASAPAAFYALLIPMAIAHLGFGAASGLVTYPLIQAFLPEESPTEQGETDV